MNSDLKIIKKKYGEKMMQLCRELFATIIDNSPGTLSSILLETFAPSHLLYEHLIKHCYIEKFKACIYQIYHELQNKNPLPKVKVADPITLMKTTGYTLYKCTCEEDIQKFKKYYAQGEELCTFSGGRLNNCYVYFAVKDNAGKLKRSDFSHPKRQDEYGTSVISIQFTRDPSHTLSIKNRYNHTVPNPDATYSNDLDNIVPGLTQSFADYYDMEQTNKHKKNYDFCNLVKANDGKFYLFNYEINNIYYCPGNIIIDNFQVKEYAKEKYIVMDYFILDLVNKKIMCLCDDSFPETIPDIKKINIENNKDKKIITLIPYNGQDIVIELDKYNRIISLVNNNVKTVPNNFLSCNHYIENISLDNAVTIGKYFLSADRELENIFLPNVTSIGDFFLTNANVVNIDLSKVISIGDWFLSFSSQIQTLVLPEVEIIGNEFLTNCYTIESISLPKVKTIGNNFLSKNKKITTISLPEVVTIANDFMLYGQIREIFAPKLVNIGSKWLCYNEGLINIDLPSVITIEYGFLGTNMSVKTISMPNVKTIGACFMGYNHHAIRFYAPKLESRVGNETLKQLLSQSKKEQKDKLSLKTRLLKSIFKK